jgi:ABC-type Fe3+ transport system substrate-binding protein
LIPATVLKWWPSLFQSLIIAFLAITLQTGPVFGEEHELVIVSSHWEGIKREFERGFNRYRDTLSEPRVTFRWLDLGGTSDILRFIKGSFSQTPESIGIDLFFGGGTDPYLELASAELLLPVSLPPEVGEGLPADIQGFPLRDREGRWYAASLSTFGILYNKRVLSVMGLPTPRTWRDLAAPAVRSWVSFADPRKSGTAHAVVEIMLQAYGWDAGWRVLRGIGRNARSFTSSSSQVPKEVAVGEAAYGFLLDSYGRDALKTFGAENLGYVIPTEHTPYTGDAIAVMKGAPHETIAKQFLAFVLSDAGQRLLLAKQGTVAGPESFELGKLSVRPELYEILGDNAVIPNRPFASIGDFRYNMEMASQRYAVVNDLVGACLIDAELQREPSCAGNSCSERDAPPITEQAAAELAASWSNPVVRQREVAAWRARCVQENPGFSITLRGRMAPILMVVVACVAFVLYARR